MHKLKNDSSFLQELIKTEKAEKFVANLHDKKEYVIHIRSLKQAIDQGSLWKKYRAINFNHEACLKSCIDINTELRRKIQVWFQKKIFFQVVE